MQFDSTWDQFRTKVYWISIVILGLKKQKHRDWFDENDHRINKLLEKKNKLYQKYFGTFVKDRESSRQNHHSNVAYVG